MWDCLQGHKPWFGVSFPPIFSPLMYTHHLIFWNEINIFGSLRRAGLRHKPSTCAWGIRGLGVSRVGYVSVFPFFLARPGCLLAELEPTHLNFIHFSWRHSENKGETVVKTRASYNRIMWKMFFLLRLEERILIFFRGWLRLVPDFFPGELTVGGV